MVWNKMVGNNKTYKTQEKANVNEGQRVRWDVQGLSKTEKLWGMCKVKFSGIDL